MTQKVVTHVGRPMPTPPNETWNMDFVADRLADGSKFRWLKSDLSTIPEASWPASAASNRQNCMADPHAANCIRFVQVQICATGASNACEPHHTLARAGRCGSR